MVLITLAFVIVFAAVHLGIGRLKFLSNAPRSAWLSAAGGVAVAYVFRVLEVAWFREPPPGDEGVREPPASMWVPAWILIGATILFGLWTDLTGGVAERAAALLMGVG